MQQSEINGAASETTRYSYDDLDRLTNVYYGAQGCPSDVRTLCAFSNADLSVTYGYDDAFNRTSEIHVDSSGVTVKERTYTINNRNQIDTITDVLDAAQNVVYGYDANGNQLSKTQASSTTEFIWDNRDNLRTVTQGGSTVGQFLYDAQGLRTEKLGDRGIERYTYDDQSVLQQTDASGTTIAKYEYGPDRLLSLKHASEGTQFYLTDALNSVVNLANASGAVQARYKYDAWGNKREQVGDSWNRFAFTGYEEDTESGLLYAKARFYDPDTGRFLSQDAWEGDQMTPPSLHKYLYAYGNPTVWWDPSGHISEDIAETVGEHGERSFSYNKRPENKEPDRSKTNADTAAIAAISSSDSPYLIPEDKEAQLDKWNRDLKGLSFVQEDNRGPSTEKTPGQVHNQILSNLGLRYTGYVGTAVEVFTPPYRPEDIVEVAAVVGGVYIVYRASGKLVKFYKASKESHKTKRNHNYSSADTDYETTVLPERKVRAAVANKEPFKLINGSQVRGSGGADGKFINTIDEPFDPLLGKKAELRLGADGRWKLYGVGQPRTPKGSFDFIVQDGKVYVGTMKQRGQGHIEIAQGKPVDYAGKITFGSGKNTKGILNSWDNGSGHYIPEPVQPSWADTIPLPFDLFKTVEHSP